MKYKCLCCKKNYSNKIDDDLKKRFKNAFKFSNNNINRSILLFRKGAYPHEYMVNWNILMKHHCLKRKNSIATLIWKLLQIQITYMQHSL